MKISLAKIGSIAILVVVLSASPFLLYAFPWHPHKEIIAASSILLLLCLFIGGWNYRLGRDEIVLLVAIALAWGSQAIHLEARALTLVPHITAFAMVLLFLSNTKNFQVYVNFYCNLALAIATLALASHLLYLSGQLALVPVFPRPGTEGQWIFQFGLALTNALPAVGEWRFPRNAGWFDEPGAFGLFLTHVILLELYIGRALWRRFVYVFAGITTVSLGFAVSMVLLVMLSIILFQNHRLRLRKWIRRGGAFTLVLVIAVVLSFPYWEGPVVAKLSSAADVLLIDRVFQDTDNLLEGDNRQASLRAGLMAFQQNPIFGTGKEGFDELADFSSLLGPLGAFGLFGYLALAIPSLYYLSNVVRRRDRQAMLCALIIVANFFHRPFSLGFNSYLLIYLFIKLSTLRRQGE